jgi:hypothetical protein
MPGPTRRSVLLGAAAAALLAACGGDDDDATPGTGTGGTGATGDGDSASTASSEAAGSPVLGAAFDRNGLLVTGIPQRATYVLFEQTGGLLPADQAPEQLTFTVVPPSGTALPDITVDRHGLDVGRAYYPMVTTFTEAGQYDVRATIDGGEQSYPINVNDPAAVVVPQVGQPMPSGTTPTTANPLGATTLCTRETPCPFHEVSLDAALAEGRPVALLVSTPAYCQVAICGPVLDLLVTTAPTVPDVAYIHVEVYPFGAPPDAEPQPLVSDLLRVHYEPVLFVADAAGTITSRLDFVYDTPELASALAAVTA